MPIFPEELIRMAATGSSPRAKASIDQKLFPLLKDRDKDETPERELLLNIASYGLQNQAGYIPDKRFEKLPSKAEISEKHACNITARHHLTLMLNHIHEELLPCWLGEIHKYNQRIPDEMLPPMLDYGANQADKYNYALLREAIGERGRWLARQANNPAWDWVLQEETQETISDNHYAAWENHFRRMRQDDPVRALNILRSYWQELDSLMQMALLRVMYIGINEDDADFLWDLFEEEISRFTAARWLIQIPETEFAIQARENIGKLIAMIEVGHRNQPVVDFTWSSTFDGHPLQIKRDEANQLCDILGYDFNPELMLKLLPLSYWYETYHVTPDELILAARNGTRPSIFYRTWATMAIQDSDSDFLFALAMNVEKYAGLSFFEYLSQSQLIEAATHWLKKKPVFSLQHNAVKILDAITITWSEELAEVFQDSLQACFREFPRPLLEKNIRQALKRYARLLPLSVDKRFETVLQVNKRGDLSDAETEQLNGIISIIQFRSEMIEAIKAGIQ